MPTPPASPNGNPLERARCFEELDTLRRRGQVPFFVPLERNEGPMCRIDGRQAIMLGSNNYLGLTADPRVRRATARAALAEGPSLTGSRLLNGSTVDHRILEKRLARFLGYEEVLVFTTGYQANLGLLSALMDEKGCLLVDDACHASIYDGGFMSRCQIREFRHNDARDLEKKLSRLAPDRERFVMVDGVYSMHGDIAPLPAIDRVCHTWNTPYAVDEAHALGVLGDCGRGTQEHFDFKCRADLLTGTFSKSLASIGGWIAGENKVIDWIRFKGRSMLFSASLPPPSVAAALAALDILETEPQRLVQLHHNADYFRRRLANAGFSCGRAATPIIPIFIGDEELCLSYTGQLLASGLFVNASIHPAVPRGQSLLRTSVMATHTIDLLDQAADIIIRVGRKMGIGADRQRHGAPR